MGAGDAKLMGAIGAILGAKNVFIAGVYTAIFGGVYTVILVIVKRKECAEFIERYVLMLKVFILTQRISFIPAQESEKTPKLFYGVAIACGTLTAIFGKRIGINFLS